MIKALAPRMRRGCSWVWLSIVLVALLPPFAAAQTPGKEADSKGKAAVKDEEKPAAGPGEAKPKADGAEPAASEEEKNTGSVEVFKDPNTDAILQKQKDKKFGTVGRACSPTVIKQFQLMAEAQVPPDRAVIQQAVDGLSFILTTQSNVAAFEEEGKVGTGKVLKMKEALDNLIVPLEKARKLKNNAFLSTYNQVLLATMPRLFDNNLYARLNAMIVLGYTSNPDAVKIFAKQLTDANQSVWVKLWAARGLTKVADEGRREIQAATAVEGSRALAEWIKKEPEMPWPALMRAVEALGALRQASTPTSPGNPEFATVVMHILTDPKARPEVRARAAWAMGLLRVNAISNYNLKLVAHVIGQLAAELGERAVEAFDSNPGLTEHWTGMLLYQIYPALGGMDGARESGLLHTPGSGSNVTAARNYIKQLDSSIKPVAAAAVTLLRSPKGSYNARKKDLGDRVASLNLFLEKNAPKDTKLVPSGDSFPLRNAEVAEAPGAK